MTEVKTATRKPTKRTVDYILSKGTKIGSGAYRNVYRTKYGKWVVKVDMRPGARIGNNEHEYAAYLSLRAAMRNKLPDNVKLPEMHLIGNILVAEYIKGVHPDSWCGLDSISDYTAYHASGCKNAQSCWVTRLNGLKIKDIHKFNVIMTEDNILYLIDIGYGEG